MTRKKTRNEFIAQSVLKHGHKYDYSKSQYVSSHIKTCIICPIHGEFYQTPANHVYGFGCKNCRNIMSQATFVEKANNIHNNKYCYSKLHYTHNKIPVTIICYKHGEFTQEPGHHLEGKGCQKCCRSKGEEKIEQFLINNNIKFFKQHKFESCLNDRTGYKLRFDFFLPELNLIIEYDGKQHFDKSIFWHKITEKSEKEFESRKNKDEIKTKYAESNGIKLFRIPFTQFKTIEKRLGEFLAGIK